MEAILFFDFHSMFYAKLHRILLIYKLDILIVYQGSQQPVLIISVKVAINLTRRGKAICRIWWKPVG